MRHGFSLKNLAPRKSAWKSPALWAGIGIGVTSAIALALAPRKGKALREQVKEKLTGKSEQPETAPTAATSDTPPPRLDT